MKKNMWKYDRIRGLSSYQLKWIAVVSMMTDHIGMIFYPEMTLFRYIGRIAFPVFAFLLVEGFFYTRDVVRYLVRLGMFAVLSEIPYDLVFQGSVLEFSHQNIFFTLFLSVFMMYHLSMPGNWKVRCVKLFMAMWVASILHVDYSYMGIFLVFIYYEMHRCGMTVAKDNEERFRADDSVNDMIDNRRKFWFLLSGIWNFLWPGKLQRYGTLAMPVILLYNGEHGRKSKYFFYVLYPGHLILIYLIHNLFS